VTLGRDVVVVDGPAGGAIATSSKDVHPTAMPSWGHWTLAGVVDRR
jgi:hypothetical protein